MTHAYKHATVITEHMFTGKGEAGIFNSHLSFAISQLMTAGIQCLKLWVGTHLDLISGGSKTPSNENMDDGKVR